ncbi:hypothetical protein OSSY52_06890 [Tepiditoga spiralis]|uniref:Uncharacterized protein n=1 Tax=Tepiditoga spiralis TaxID=2108365 RepID=A0A7G1G2M0_9BACT|nr:hypothetical protein [Tepiditoga spiralis]BBE30548.1 hypothetical protein OSSY52_06890 [Tepiditoga spiralis]
MAVYKKKNGDYFEIKPNFIKKILFNQNKSSDSDILEKYSFEVSLKTGDYVWYDNEFNLEKNTEFDKLKINMEYIPFILTLTRINSFLESDKKNMVSVLSTELDHQTQNIIDMESLIYSLNESTDITFLYLKKDGRYIEHHLLFSSYDYQNYFDLFVKFTKKQLLDFYKSLLKELNSFRSSILPEIIDKLTKEYGEASNAKEVSYNYLINKKDEIFNIYDVNLKRILEIDNASDELKEYINYLKFLKTRETREEDFISPEVELDFIIEDMDEIEDKMKEIFDENFDEEEDFIELFDELLSGNSKSIQFEIKDALDELKMFKDDVEKEDVEKEILLKLINYFGKDMILNQFEKLSKLFEFLNLEEDFINIYNVSEDKKINEYKQWYRNLFNDSKNIGKKVSKFKY